MINQSLKISEKNLFYYTVIIIVLIQALISFQGFDVCDEGFSLTFYQQFYRHPENVEYNFVYWLSGLIGGLWYNLFPKGGILWFRILAIVFNTSTFILGYKILKPYLGNLCTLVGLAMALFVNNYGYLVFYHNPLTALMALIAIYFLLKGMKTGKTLFMVLSGIVVGLSVFARIPNITLVLLMLILPLWAYLQKRLLKEFIKPVLSFVFGIAIGWILVFLLLLALGQLEIMEKALGSLVELGRVENSGHNSGHLLNVYVSQQIKVIFILGLLLVYGLFVWLSVSLISSRKIKNIVLLFSSVLFFLLDIWDH